jgi:ABC-type uncharacterized transport system permease subunit
MFDKPSELIHVLLATTSFAIFVIAGLQAVVLAVQDYNLRKKTRFVLMQRLPPVETIEVLLFRLIGLGFLFLTLLLTTSFIFYTSSAAHFFWQKIILASLAWLVFAILLVGRYGLGWRGRKAIYATLVGVSLLTVIYFGSELLLS